jgi:sterol desaturase/sphingolipid hydroxylase (fatty acid hydroxylase superfamily)
MSVRRHEHQTRTSDSHQGFWLFGSVSVVLAVLKLTVAGYWSWWRVMLPFLAFLGHNAVYLLAGFVCFGWLKHEEDEEEPTTVQKHSRAGYNIAALLFFFLFLDNLLRRAQGQGWKGFWPCSGSYEVVVLFGMLRLAAQFVYWSRIVSGLNQEHA